LKPTYINPTKYNYTLLIAPKGIETWDNSQINTSALLLIAPKGIETKKIGIVGGEITRLLIAPKGIET